MYTHTYIYAADTNDHITAGEVHVTISPVIPPVWISILYNNAVLHLVLSVLLGFHNTTEL